MCEIPHILVEAITIVSEEQVEKTISESAIRAALPEKRGRLTLPSVHINQLVFAPS